MKEKDTTLINRVATSALATLDLGELYPTKKIAVFDLKDFLFREAILMEKKFREDLAALDASSFQDKIVAITCSADALIPNWAFMLVVGKLQGIADSTYFGTSDEVEEKLLLQAIEELDVKQYQDGLVVIKGCGDKATPAAAFVAVSRKLIPVVKSLMFGEPCSTVPVYKRPKK